MLKHISYKNREKSNTNILFYKHLTLLGGEVQVGVSFCHVRHSRKEAYYLGDIIQKFTSQMQKDSSFRLALRNEVTLLFIEGIRVTLLPHIRNLGISVIPKMFSQSGIQLTT